MSQVKGDEAGWSMCLQRVDLRGDGTAYANGFHEARGPVYGGVARGDRARFDGWIQPCRGCTRGGRDVRSLNRRVLGLVWNLVLAQGGHCKSGLINVN